MASYGYCSSENHYEQNGRHPTEHNEPFDLERHVMDEAHTLPYYWPKHTSQMANETLQDASVEDGSFMLRPTTNKDVKKGSLLTLSVKMDFSVSDSAAKVWHFPVRLDVTEKDTDSPKVEYSLTQGKSDTCNYTLKQLMEFHRCRPLKGGDLPGNCLVTQGLKYPGNRDEDNLKTPLKTGKRNHRGTGYVDVSLSENPDLTFQISTLQLPSPPEPRPASPTGGRAPATLPRSIHSPTPMAPEPKPRKHNTIPRGSSPIGVEYGANSGSESHVKRLSPPTPPRREPATPPPRELPPKVPIRPPPVAVYPKLSEETDELCDCGIPIKYTKLQNTGWEVHKSCEGPTKDLLFFKNPKGQTTWIPDPDIDRTCTERKYLAYGRLNVDYFDMYKKVVAEKMSQNSELYNYRTYSI